MSVAGDVEAAVASAVPVAGRARLARTAITALLAGALLAFMLWWLLVRPRQAQVAAATARVEAATATGTAGAAIDTLRVQQQLDQDRARIDALTMRNAHAIQSAPGAGDPIGDDLDRAGHAALCLHAAYRADPGCAAMRGDGGGFGTARADAGSAAP